MKPLLIFALLIAASCHRQHFPETQTCDADSRYYPGSPVLIAKIEPGGELRRYYYSSEDSVFETTSIHLAATLQYIGRGRAWSRDGVLVSGAGRVEYFWGKK